MLVTIRPRCLARSLGLESASVAAGRSKFVQSRTISSSLLIGRSSPLHRLLSSSRAQPPSALLLCRHVASKAAYPPRPPPYREPNEEYMSRFGRLIAPRANKAVRSNRPKYTRLRVARDPDEDDDDQDYDDEDGPNIWTNPYRYSTHTEGEAGSVRPDGRPYPSPADPEQRDWPEMLGPSSPLDVDSEERNWQEILGPHSHWGYNTAADDRQREPEEKEKPKEEPKSEVGLKEFILNSQAAFSSDREVTGALADLGLDSLHDLVPGMTIALMPHQVLGVDWMVKQEATAHKGGILADDMGLGKTVQMVAVMARDRVTHPKKKQITLIVVPLTLMAQWTEEIEAKTEPGLFKVLIHHGPKRTTVMDALLAADVVITTYQTLTLDVEDEGPLSQMSWHRIILDEAHHIRNHNTHQSVAVPRLESTYRWTLTGTPVFNKVDDLYPLFRFLNITSMEDWDTFQRIALGKGVKGMTDKYSNEERMQMAIKAVMLRRTKDATLDGKPILDLVELTETTEHLTFSAEETLRYDFAKGIAANAFLAHMSSSTSLVGPDFDAMVQLLRLRQLTCHPSLASGVGTSKLLRDLVQNEADHQTACEVHGEKWVEATMKDLESRELGPDGQACAVCSKPAKDPMVTSCCREIICAGCTWKIRGQKWTPEFPVTVEGEFHPEGGKMKKKKTTSKGKKGKKLADGVVGEEADPTSPTEPPGSTCPTCKTHLEPRGGLLRASAFMAGPSDFHSDDLPDIYPTGPLKVPENPNRRVEPGTKMLRMLELIKEWSDEDPEAKILIFSQFTSYLDLIERYLRQEGHDSIQYTGQTSASQRNAVLGTFTRKPDPNILLMSVKAGGVGLNITRANKIIFMDLNWSPFVEKQAVARAHRIGQMKPVDVRHLVIADTVEDVMLAIQRTKLAAASMSLGDGPSAMPSLSKQEFAKMFGVDLPEAVVVVGEKSELDVDVGSRKEEGEVAAEEVTDGVEEAGEKFEKVEI